MSHNYQEEASKEVVEEQKITVRNRQPNGPARGEAPPVRRSWRPCQINQDGELNLHHHHHEHHPPPHHHHAHHLPAGRGPSRHRRRPPSAQGQSQVQSPGSAPVVMSSRTGGGEVWSADHLPVPQHRPAVTRYRRHGDPNPRLKGHRQRQPNNEKQEILHGVDERGVPVEPPVNDYPTREEPLDQGSPHQTPIAVVTPTHLCTAPATQNVQPHPQETPPAEVEENFQDLQNTKADEVVKVDQDVDGEKMKDDESRCSTALDVSFNQDSVEEANIGAKERTESMEEEPSEVLGDAATGVPAAGSEINDLCSDTESAASLSMDGPLHSPPPLHSPTPPSSPDVPTFPQIDHFSEEPSMSPVLDDDQPEDEDRSESTYYTDSYPKTYADFYSESHQKSCPESVYTVYAETKPHPTSFPEPLKTSYSEAPRDPCWQPNQRTGCDDQCHQETFTKQTEETPTNKVSSFSHTMDCSPTPWQVKNRGSHFSPPDRSVGCRLHHYDEESDEDDSSGGGRSFGQKSLRFEPGQSERQDMSPLSGQNSSGDAISLAIKDIKEAIEEVKTKAVPSPYTPDCPEEPIWVMRQEDTFSLHTDQSSSQSDSEAPYVSCPARENASPKRRETCRSTHPSNYQQPQHQLQLHHQHQSQHTQEQQRDTLRSPLMCQKQQQQQQQQAEHQHPQPQHHPQRLHDQPQTPPPSAPPPPQQQQQQMSVQEIRRSLPSFPTFVDVLGPCDPEDLIDGIIFAATYLGCTHLLSERTPSKSARMQQAQEAMSRVRAAQKQAKNKKKSPDAEASSTTEVDLFMSTQRIKVLNADSQECLMDLPLRTISYIADIGNMVVLMARGKMVRSHSAQENLNQSSESSSAQDDRRLYRMICHVFESEDAQLIAQSIGQSFSVAYQEFLRANGIDPEDLSQREYSDLLNTQDMYNDDLIHFSKSENCRDVYIEKQKGEILGVVIVESGWGSILPTVIIASLMHAGPAEKSGRLNIGDQIMTVNGTSLVGLPLGTCQSIIKGLKSQSRIKLNIVRCPPVTMVLIRRPDLRYQLGFSVQNGIICSLMRGGIAERGGVRVGHRIIEINSQSVVATPHEKIVQILSNAMGEIHMKTMPAAMYRLLTAQEQPVYI